MLLNQLKRRLGRRDSALLRHSSSEMPHHMGRTAHQGQPQTCPCSRKLKRIRRRPLRSISYQLSRSHCASPQRMSLSFLSSHPSFTCLRSPSCSSLQWCRPLPYMMARHMALFNILLVGLMAITFLDVEAVSAAPSAPTDQLIQAVCAGSTLHCTTDNYLALETRLETRSDDVTDLRDASISTINDYQRDFFVETALVEGGSLSLDENLRDPAPRRPFLTSDAAAAMPTGARDMISHFGLARGSTMAKDVATAAYLCGNPALPGEAFRCAASVEAVGAFVAAELGRSVKVYKTTGAPSSAPAVKGAPVNIVEVAKGSLAEGKRIVVCHHLPFPAELFYCHRVTDTKVVKAALKPAGGLGSSRAINAVGVCHMDTSMWLSRHPAFKALGIAHGDAACHFLVDGDLVFTSGAAKETE